MKTAKRFYKEVSTDVRPDGYSVLLDGISLKTPGKLLLIAPSLHIANLVASEWDAQTDEIKPETMPVTRLLNVATEQTPHNREKLIAEARRYAGTDLLCYRAVQPVRLTERQSNLWNPVLSWAESQGITLKTTQGVKAIDQADQSLNKVADYANAKDNLELTLFVHLIAVFGSAILSMAVIEKHITGQNAFALSRLDNLFQIEQWGKDDEATEIAANLEAEVIQLCKILES